MEPPPIWVPRLDREKRLRFCLKSIVGVRSFLGKVTAGIRNYDLLGNASEGAGYNHPLRRRRMSSEEDDKDDVEGSED